MLQYRGRCRLPELSSTGVFASMNDLCWPGSGALSGTIVGTVIAPAVMTRGSQ